MNTTLQSTPQNQNSTESNGRCGSPASAHRVAYVAPIANVQETQEGYVLRLEVPGVSKDGLEISVEGEQLTVVGRRSATPPEGRPVYRESRQEDYRRSFRLDPAIDTAQIEARLEQGILTLTLPKKEAAKPRTIPLTD